MKLNKEHERYVDLYRNGFLFDAESKTIFTNKVNPKLPKDYEDWTIEKIDLKEYYKERLNELGATEKDNQIELIDEDGHRIKEKIFAPNKFGDIEILQYSIDRKYYKFFTKGTDNNSSTNKEEYHVQTRLNPIHANMCEGKYDFKKAINAPIFPKRLVEQYENKEEIEVFGITEGQIKSFKACLDGINLAGLTSISHFKNASTLTIHPDIISYINTCKVKRFVILWDGDCRDISTEDIELGKDLGKRPQNFYLFALKIRDLIKEFCKQKDFSIHFATILSDNLDKNSKGIDDLLIDYKAQRKTIVKDFNNIGLLPSKFFWSKDITKDISSKKLREFFNINNVRQFYSAHQEKIGNRDFVFLKNTYKVEKGEPIIKIDANLKKYLRIGFDYYKKVQMPVPIGIQGETTTEEQLRVWQKGAIQDDHEKGAINHITKYEAFTNVPSHVNYQQVINSCYNLYSNVEHETKSGDFPSIKKLLKHLFAEQYDLIIDYLTILYKHPMQKLPVICLVSRQQATGKSTFLYLVKLIFKQNMTFISNQDLQGDFTAHWIDKLVVASEETMLDKKDAYEKIKNISTAKVYNRNEKNKSQQEIPCYVKFMFASNHEDDFIRIDDYDSRLWIRKVATIPEKDQDSDFDSKLETEIPCFVNFLLNREIKHPKVDRLWFKPAQFRTKAFEAVVKNSEASLIKELREHLFDSFNSTGVTEQQMTARLIKDEFNIKFELNYINKEIKRTLKLETRNSSYAFYKVDEVAKQIVKIEGKGRFFTFKREDFCDAPATIIPDSNQTSILDYE